MSIINEIIRIKNAKLNIKSSIENKGVIVGDATIDTYAEKIDSIQSQPNLQEKEVTPTKELQEILPDEEYDGLSKVKVNKIPDEYIMPTGTKTFTNNGFYDVREISSAFVNVQSKTGSKTITKNGTYYAMADSLDGYNTVIVNVEASDDDGSRWFRLAGTVQDQGSIAVYLKEIPQIDTSKVKYMNSLFYNGKSIVKIPELDAHLVITVASAFTNCSMLRDFGGLLNFGQACGVNTAANSGIYKLDLSTCINLTYDSLMNVINKLYDIKTKGCKAQMLVLGTTNLAKLTAEEIAIASNKGWTVS